MNDPNSEKDLRDDLYRVAALLADVERVLYPLPGTGGAGFGVEPNPPPPLPPTGVPMIGAGGKLSVTGGQAGSMARPALAEPSAGRAADRPWVESDAVSFERRPGRPDQAAPGPAPGGPARTPAPTPGPAETAAQPGSPAKEAAPGLASRPGSPAEAVVADLRPERDAAGRPSRTPAHTGGRLGPPPLSRHRRAPPRPRPEAGSDAADAPPGGVLDRDAKHQPVDHGAPMAPVVSDVQAPGPAEARPATSKKQPLPEFSGGQRPETPKAPEGTRVRPPREPVRTGIDPSADPLAAVPGRGPLETLAREPSPEPMSRTPSDPLAHGQTPAGGQAAPIDIQVGRDAIPTGYDAPAAPPDAAGPDALRADVVEAEPDLSAETLDAALPRLAFERLSPIESKRLGGLGDPRRQRIERRITRCFLDRVGRRL